MCRVRRVALVVVQLMVVGVLPSAAQTPSPGDWSVVDGQPMGTAVAVEIIGGEVLTGTIVATRDIDFTLARARGEHRAIPKSSVVEVRTRDRVSDPLRNGMTYGGLAGAAAMGVLIAALFATCEGTCDAPSVPAVLLPALALGAGGGIGAGAAVDAAIGRPLILYRSPAPPPETEPSASRMSRV